MPILKNVALLTDVTAGVLSDSLGFISVNVINQSTPTKSFLLLSDAFNANSYSALVS